MTETWVLVSAAASFGLASSLHCATMCGPLVGCWASGRQAAGRYHVARLASYTLAGAAVGALGSLVPRAAGDVAGRVLPAVAATLFVLHVAGILPRLTARIPLGGLAAGLSRRAAALSPSTRALFLGALTPLLPCATLAGMLALTLAAGTATVGALVMATFALSTAPALVASQMGLAAARSFLSGARRKQLQHGLVALSTLLVVVRAVLATQGQSCH